MASLLAGAGNPFARLWRSYERCLERRPVATQSVTSGALWALGDVLAQKFTSDSKQPLDVRRAALTGVFGGAVIGPAGTWWYAHLDRFAALFGHEGTLRFLLAKLAADSTVWNVWYMSAFFLWGEVVIERGTLKDFAKQMEEEFVPTYLAEVAAWPPIMAAIFTRLPTAHHLLAVNLVTVLDVAFLAVIRSGAFSLGGSPDSASSSQGEELHDEPSEEPATPSGSSKAHAGAQAQQQAPPRGPQQQQPQQQGGGAGGAGGGGGGTNATNANNQQQQQQQQQFMVPALASMYSSAHGRGGAGGSFKQQASLIEQWVLPEHKEDAQAAATAAAAAALQHAAPGAAQQSRPHAAARQH